MGEVKRGWSRIGHPGMKRPPFPYAALFDAIPIGLYRRTADGRLTDVNQALLQASGWPDAKTLLARDVRRGKSDALSERLDAPAPEATPTAA